MKEQKVISLLIEQDESGIEMLLEHYGPLMKYIIAPIVVNEQDREACLYEVTMKVWEKIGQYDYKKGSWNAWLTAVTRNTALNYKRQSARYEKSEKLSEQLVSDGETPEEAVIKREQKEAMYRALQKLSFKDRTIFYRKYYYMQPISQIASEMGTTERAIEGKLYRIRKQLRKMLGGEWYD